MRASVVINAMVAVVVGFGSTLAIIVTARSTPGTAFIATVAGLALLSPLVGAATQPP